MVHIVCIQEEVEASLVVLTNEASLRGFHDCKQKTQNYAHKT